LDSELGANAGRFWPLWILLGVYWTAALSSPLNIGHRHILPTYPALFVLAGGAGLWFQRSTPVAAAVVALLLAGFALESVRAYPHELAYFNQLVDRRQAYRHLVDSSLDWGQDLPGLRDWLNARGKDFSSTYLAYFGTARPESYGITAEWIPVAGWLPRDREAGRMAELRAGVYCISATALQSVYGEFPGRWNRRYERYYEEVREFVGSAARAGRKRNEAEQSQLERALWEYDRLRAARLMALLRAREPDHQIGFSILIYRLSDADIARLDETVTERVD
jgi:hypothetical protein